MFASVNFKLFSVSIKDFISKRKKKKYTTSSIIGIERCCFSSWRLRAKGNANKKVLTVRTIQDLCLNIVYIQKTGSRNARQTTSEKKGTIKQERTGLAELKKGLWSL
jgi:hypothetical protein